MDHTGIGARADQCFNCHSQLERRRSHDLNSGPPARGITVIKSEDGQDSSALISYSEALTYIFELQPPAIDRLHQLSIDEGTSLELCDCCSALLATVYSSRLQFAALTSRNSFLHSILSLAEEDVAPFPEVEVEGWEDDRPGAEEGQGQKHNKFNECYELEEDPLRLEPLQFNARAASPVANRRRVLQRPRQRREETGTCPQCGKGFRSSRRNIELAIKRHTELVHSKSGYICKICGKPNYNKNNLDLHATTHMNAEEKVALLPAKPGSLCAECGASFRDVNALRCHTARVHERRPMKRTRYNCDQCDYTTTSGRKSLLAHQRRHEIEASDETPFGCPKCPARFKTKMDLKYHPPACPAEAATRPHQCIEEGCGRRFQYRHGLELHMNEFHKFGPIKARELVYPGLPVKPSSLRKRIKKKKAKTTK